MRRIEKTIYLLLLSLLLSLPALTAPPDPVLVCALYAPSSVNLSQSTAITLRIGCVYAEGEAFPDTVTLKTDLGYFEGTKTQQIEVKQANYSSGAKLCFDKLANAPTQPCHVSLLVKDKEVAQATITLRQATSIVFSGGPAWVPIGPDAKPWELSWNIFDQFGKPLPGVPGIVSYTLPGASPSAVSGVSGENGLLEVTLPPAVCEGEYTARLVTSTCSSEKYSDFTNQDRARALPNLVAVLGVPALIEYPTQEDIPILIDVTSRDGRPLLDSLTVFVQSTKFIVPLKEGKGRLSFSLRELPILDPIKVTAVVDEPTRFGGTETRIVGQALIPVNHYPSKVGLQVTPLAQRTKDDPAGTLTVTMMDGNRPFAHLPVMVWYKQPNVGCQRVMLETDEIGIASCPIPAGAITDIHVVGSIGFSTFLPLKHDNKGRLTAWGDMNSDTLKFEAIETITYDAEGNPVVTKLQDGYWWQDKRRLKNE